MIFMTVILYLVFVIFINEAIAQFHILMHTIVKRWAESGSKGFESESESLHFARIRIRVSYFNAYNSDTLDRLHSFICRHIWNLSKLHLQIYNSLEKN